MNFKLSASTARTLTAFALLFSLKAGALEPWSPGLTLGVPDGSYVGGGLLHSSSPSLTLTYQSHRELQDGVIVAKTKAFLSGLAIAEASARLLILPTGENSFEVVDLATSSKAGSGRCLDNQCQFEATVMNGRLTLNETWIRNQFGFSLVQGSQVMDGRSATYSGTFMLKKSDRPL